MSNNVTKREISGGVRTPMVFITASPGLNFIGVMSDNTGKAIKMSKGEKYLFQFKCEDGSAPIMLKGADKNYTEATVNAGDLVAVLATAALKDKLVQCQLGERVEIVYKGKKKSESSGNMFHDFAVSVLEG